MRAKLVGPVVLLALGASRGAAQTIVTGEVRDAAGGALASAQIVVAGSTVGAVASGSGRYRLVIPKGAFAAGDSVTLRARRIGFGAEERRIALRGDSVRVDFRLTAVATTLDAVVVGSGREGDIAPGPVREYAAMRDEMRGSASPVKTGGVSSHGVSAGRGGAVTDSAHAAELASAGVLTAAVWDDLAHWKEYRRYLDGAAQAGENEWGLDPSRATKPAAIAKGRARSSLDLGFLVDATGSMSDEMQFLQTELLDIVTRVHAAEPELDIRMSIVFYRDRGDEFVTKTLPFTRDLDAAIAFLEGTRADGGGDYPEDMNAGFAAMMKQDWSTDVAPRMLFVIGDAPPQKYQDERYTFREAIRDAGKDRVAIYPVAASGIDKPTEYLFRAMAAMTGGKYVFLTDDSGVGSSHEKPDISGYEVEKLNELMVREIRKYVKGYLAPTTVAAR